MTPAARLSAAMEVLDEINARHHPIAHTLKEWGRAHRFAGSTDRIIIGNLVFDVFRRKGSLAWLMESENPRALVLALYARFWSDPATLVKMCTGEDFSPAPLSENEVRCLQRDFSEAPEYVQSFNQEWIYSRLLAVYNKSQIINEGAALAERAPIDIRINPLRTTLERVEAKLGRYKPSCTPLAPLGLRIAYGSGETKNPAVEVEDVFQRGHVELQDEGSQLVSILAGAQAGEQVLDYCAGAGGKTLAMSVQMENKGQIIATDNDPHRLTKIYNRLKRAQARNVQVKPQDQLPDFAGRMDKVVLDVPCTGVGAWRRRPDNKWRLDQQTLVKRCNEQDIILQQGSKFTRPGGELIYITCSLLREENEDRVRAFLNSEYGSNFKAVDMRARWTELLKITVPQQSQSQADLSYGLRLSPASSNTDGFFISCLKRTA